MSAVDAVDLFYLRMAEVRDIGDGSQDALLVRVRSGEHTGWGECEASPLASIAAFVAPMSHIACKPVGASVLGQPLNDPSDIVRINALVRENSFDLLQADHMLSGVDIALWDLLGRRLQEPVYRLLGQEEAFPKVAYASQLFGDSPAETFERAVAARQAGFRAAKFGWGPFGRGTVADDEAQLRAAREGLGARVSLLVDAGTVWIRDVTRAAARIPLLEAVDALWLEEPFANGELGAYRDLAAQSGVNLAGGEGCHNAAQARLMIDTAGIGFIQIDAGRVGGLTSAREVAGYARERGVRYVNHTFTSSLALSASLQAYVGSVEDELCEMPFSPSPLARNLTMSKVEPDAFGLVTVPDAPGLGLDVEIETVRRYLVEVEVQVGGAVLFRSDAELLGSG